jgi:hypothetical protein
VRGMLEEAATSVIAPRLPESPVPVTD